MDELGMERDGNMLHAFYDMATMPTSASSTLVAEAEAALDRGNLPEASSHYMAAVRQTPENGEAWLGLSRVLALMGEFDRAAALVDRAMAPEHRGQAWAFLSAVLLEMREFDRAAQLVDRAITLDPNNALAYLVQAVVFQHVGNDAAAAVGESACGWHRLVDTRRLGPERFLQCRERFRAAECSAR